MPYYSPSTGGFYDVGVRPEDSIQVSPKERSELLIAQYGGKTLKVVDGKVVAVDPSAPGLDQMKVMKLREINTAAQAAVSSYLAGYPEFEVQTWATQQAELVAWRAATASERTESLIPWCSIAAKARGVEVNEFMEKVADKVAAFVQVSAQVAGTRQALEDSIASASTPEYLASICWPSSP